MQKLTDDLNRVTRENLTGLRVVRAYNAEDYQETKFAQANAALTGNQLFAQRTLAFLLPSIQLVMSGLSLAIYWIGGVLIDQAGMQAKLTLFSDMMVFSQYAIQVVMAFMMLVMIFMILPRASVAAHRIGEVLHTHPTILDGTQASGDPACPGAGGVPQRLLPLSGRGGVRAAKTSPSPPNGGRRWPSSAPPAAARAPWST